MIVFEVETKVLDTEICPQHTITDLIPGITFIVLLSKEKPLRGRKNTHRHVTGAKKYTKVLQYLLLK